MRVGTEPSRQCSPCSASPIWLRHREGIKSDEISVSPFFVFVLGLVVPGALVIMLMALLWTGR
jgi:hypothetical protein